MPLLHIQLVIERRIDAATVEPSDRGVSDNASHCDIHDDSSETDSRMAPIEIHSEFIGACCIGQNRESTASYNG